MFAPFVTVPGQAMPLHQSSGRWKLGPPLPAALLLTPTRRPSQPAKIFPDLGKDRKKRAMATPWPLLFQTMSGRAAVISGPARGSSWRAL